MKHSYIDEHSHIDSPIHRLEPRVKIIAFFAFVLFVIFTQPDSFTAFALYSVFIGVLIVLSKIPLGYILKRTLVIIPFILLAASGALFAYDGLMVLWNVAVKAFLSVLCMTLLTATTKFPDFLKALERLKCPKIMVMILSFMYRYIFVLYDELMKMFQAKQARSVGGGRLFHARALASMIGALFIRTYERAEAVYLAMCSRGFDGEIKTIDGFELKLKDFYFLFGVIVILLGIGLFAG